MSDGFIHAEVQAAREELIAWGTAIYPQLVQHLEDRRYSYSIISAAWLNQSVGQAVADIMAEGIEFSGYGYKSRRNKDGSNGEPHFSAMAREIGWKRYAQYVATRSKAQLQKEFVRWKLTRMYEFSDLLILVDQEGASELDIRVYIPPTILLNGIYHRVEGPALTPADTETLVRTASPVEVLAGIKDRESRKFRVRGAQFRFEYEVTVGIECRNYFLLLTRTSA